MERGLQCSLWFSLGSVVFVFVYHLPTASHAASAGRITSLLHGTQPMSRFMTSECGTIGIPSRLVRQVGLREGGPVGCDITRLVLRSSRGSNVVLRFPKIAGLSDWQYSSVVQRRSTRYVLVLHASSFLGVGWSCRSEWRRYSRAEDSRGSPLRR